MSDESEYFTMVSIYMHACAKNMYIYVLRNNEHIVSILLIRVTLSVSCVFEAFNVLAFTILLPITFTRVISNMVRKIGRISLWDKLIENYRILHIILQVITPSSSMLIVGTMLLGMVIGVMFNVVSIE